MTHPTSCADGEAVAARATDEIARDLERVHHGRVAHPTLTLGTSGGGQARLLARSS